jgi:sterol desaturase/sphingolipid hydroxylase (fatty acid hydroxylase superfamily)
MRLSSAASYRVALVADLIAAVAFLALGVHTFGGGPGLAGLVILLGCLSYGLLEYVVHRWVLHGPPSMATRGHARHHDQPAALIATPPFIVATIALAVWAGLSLAYDAGDSALVVCGLYAGYNYFALFHHWEHHHRRNAAYGAYWRRLDRAHRLHHRRQDVNFGVSTTIWDRVFGTLFQTD